MQNQSERDKLIIEYNMLKQKEIEARESGNYSVIGRLHCEINKKHQEIYLNDPPKMVHRSTMRRRNTQ